MLFMLLMCLFPKLNFSQQVKLPTVVHGYVTEQAFDLLNHTSLWPGYDASAICSHFRTPYCYDPGYSAPFQFGTVQAGSFIEDNREILYSFGDCFIWDNGCDKGFTSTHFWDGDINDNFKWVITCHKSGITCRCEYQNAFRKALYYWNGDLTNNRWLVLCQPVFNWAYQGYKIGLRVKFKANTTISDVYKNPDNLIVASAWCELPGDPLHIPKLIFINIPSDKSVISFLSDNCDQGTLDVNALKEQIKGICWELIGRICHLYEDMGTPAHAHNDAHGGWEIDCLGGDDWYERDYLPIHFQDVNWQDALNTGGPVNLNLLQYPLRTSMYIMNQIGDRFPSNDVNGDNIIDNNLPWDHDFVHQQIDPIYDQLQNQGVGYTKEEFLNDPDFYRDKTLHYSYLYSIRMVGGFLDWTFNQFGLNSLSAPHISNLIQSNPLLINGSCNVNCILSNGYANSYNWTLVPTNSAIQMVSHGNYCTVTRGNVKSNERMPGYSVKITCRALGPYGNSERDTVTLVLSDYINTCPWIYIYNENNGWFADNNILIKSKLAENAGKEILDRYVLREHPSTINNTIKLKLVEIGSDSTLINSIKLYAVDHMQGTELGVTEAGDLVLYDSTQVASTTYATMIGGTKGRGDEITKQIQYDNTDSTYVLGDSTNEINANYTGLLNTGKGIIIGAQMDGILDPNNYCNIASLGLSTGIASITSDATFISSNFLSRWEFSNTIIPVNSNIGETANLNLNIDWNVPYKMQYASIATLNYNPDYEKTECLILNAMNNDLLNLVPFVYTKDSLSTYISPNSDITLTFAAPYVKNQSTYTKRDYLLEINGQIVPSGEGKMRVEKNITKQIQNPEPPKINKVYDNYPNPFNPTTKISYVIGKPGMVSIEIFDVLGRVIKTLVNDYKFPGSYIVEFDGSSLSSGIYFYRFKTGSINTVKKMMLIK